MGISIRVSGMGTSRAWRVGLTFGVWMMLGSWSVGGRAVGRMWAIVGSGTVTTIRCWVILCCCLPSFRNAARAVLTRRSHLRLTDGRL